MKYIATLTLLLISIPNTIFASTLDFERHLTGENKQMYSKIEKLYSQEEVKASADRVAAELTNKFSDQNPVILSVMVGGMIYTGMIVERLNFPIELDYIDLSRYNGSIEAKGNIKWHATPKTSLKNRTVVIIDDVLDRGITLAKVKEYCEQQGAKAVYTAVLTQKKRQRDPGGLLVADFVGFEVEDLFLLGYGLDYQHQFRNLPGIYVVKNA